MVGAVGQLQFEVVAHRLGNEYSCKARIQPCSFSIARWVNAETGQGATADEMELQRSIDGNAHRMAYDAVGAPTQLVEYARELQAGVRTPVAGMPRYSRTPGGSPAAPRRRLASATPTRPNAHSAAVAGSGTTCTL